MEHEKKFRRSLLQKYRSQVRKREDRLKDKYAADAQRLAELEKANSKLVHRLKRAKAGRRRTEEARDEAVHGLGPSVEGVEEQVAPAMERAEETPDSAQAASVLTKQYEHLFEALVACSNELAARLGADAPCPGGRGCDASTFLAYFDQIFAALEGPAAELRGMIEDESRQLLGVAVDRIFTNLRLLTPDTSPP